MRCIISIILLFYFVGGLSFPTLSQERKILPLLEAYQLAKTHYPLAADAVLINEISQRKLANIKKERLPTLTGNVVGQIQSEAIEIGGEGSPISVDVPLESFSAFVDVQFPLLDGGLNKAKKAVELATLDVNQQQLTVNLRSLKDRVNALFFSIKLSQQQKALLSTSIEDIDSNIRTLQAGLDNGTVLESEVAKLQVRKLELLADEVGLERDIQAYFSVLEYLTGTSLSPSTELALPSIVIPAEEPEVDRPEVELFEYQRTLINAQEGIILSAKRPKVSLFAQNGVGYPNPLNFSDISTSPFTLGGIRVTFQAIDWGKSRKEREILALQLRQNELDRRSFLFDIQSREEEFRQKIDALINEIEQDAEIVALQQDILGQTATQLGYGVINSNDYLTQVNAALHARQQLELHKIQLQQLQVEFLTLFGQL